MGAATRIASKDLKLRVRDRSAFIIGIFAPLALALIFNLVFGGAFDGELDLEYGIVDQDGGQVAAAFGDLLSEIEREGVLAVTRYETPVEAEAAIEEGEIGAFFLLEEGLSDAVFAGGSAEVQVVGDIDAQTSAQIAASIAEQFGAGVSATQLAMITSFSLLQGPPPEEAAGWGEEAAARGASCSRSRCACPTR